MTTPPTASTRTPDDYCRAVEAHLCLRNGGHLIRIVGPAFDTVRSWLERGVPLAVACHGIDRYVDRDAAKGPRRRPVRIEFCDADVLDAFDGWRRAVGVPAAPVGATDEETAETGNGSEAPTRHKPMTLALHVERVIARLTAMRAGEDRRLDAIAARLVDELDASRASLKGLRGSARHAFEARLAAMDIELGAAAKSAYPALVDEAAAEADDELAPFRSRLAAADYARARDAATDRVLRVRLGLPVIAYE